MITYELKSNILIAVTLLGCKVTVDNDRVYLSGDYITENYGYKYIRDKNLNINNDWNSLMAAAKGFNDYNEMMARNSWLEAPEVYAEYSGRMYRIKEELSTFNKQKVFVALVSACEWFLNLKEKRDEKLDK